MFGNKKQKKDAMTVFKEYKEVLDPILKQYLDEKKEEAYKISDHCGEMVGHISELTLRGGKRVRAAILYYSYLAHGGKNKEAAMRASLAMELAQTFLLIHDDIMDSDSLRRGGKTIHKIYQEVGEQKFAGKVDPEHFGQSIALLAGDTANGFSNEIITELDKYGVNPKFINRTLLELNKMYNREYYGQLLDVISELTKDFNQKNLIQVHQLKTVPYTFDAPIKMGAILAGASEKHLQRLEGYSVPLGIAFQIQDDILGMFGSTEKLGKSVTSDLQEGKRTLLILDALDKCNKEQEKIILQNLGNRKLDLDGLNAVRSIIKETGSLEKSIELAHKYVQEATSAMQRLKLRKEGKEFLIGIADYMVKRDY